MNFNNGDQKNFFLQTIQYQTTMNGISEINKKFFVNQSKPVQLILDIDNIDVVISLDKGDILALPSYKIAYAVIKYISINPKIKVVYQDKSFMRNISFIDNGTDQQYVKAYDFNIFKPRFILLKVEESKEMDLKTSFLPKYKDERTIAIILLFALVIIIITVSYNKNKNNTLISSNSPADSNQ